MNDHKSCPACQRDEMHLCGEKHLILVEIVPGTYIESESDALHWHCDKCDHRETLNVLEHENIPDDAYIYGVEKVKE